METAISAEGLRKRYGDHQALTRVDLAVPAGTILAVLGPNGAGKTTTVRILTTLLEPDEGRATVAGYDLATQAREVRGSIGLAGQYASVDERLTGRENLRLIGVLLHLGRRGAKTRADELLEQFGLVAAADRPAKTYSGGMRRRLDLAASLVGRPQVLFLDEPTTGLDLTGRRTLWDMIRNQVAEGVTVLLTTQYLEEADQLADRIAVIDRGTVIAEGTPDQLKRKVGGERLEVSAASVADLAAVERTLSGLSSGEPVTHQGTRTVSIPLTDGMSTIAAAANGLELLGIEPEDFAVRRSTLDDVFLALTGQQGEPESESESEPGATGAVAASEGWQAA
ncbi:ATP-binding cassette domain-containing protein [Streptomyces katsurahamanus]|uniref:ATP-binding cassette domain-containing protein n=1 Tax=Streptomyces katsurahamanus TaxID=2577098 RepID=A0ABW9NMV9_9ACTN|nr:ATP-binding cassette domain-containing protein [Streptomyces katsurahamanus]MQS34638.1 ATP-binding cassette domain-containing protein [Streptomyces katsurahamanus]